MDGTADSGRGGSREGPAPPGTLTIPGSEASAGAVFVGRTTELAALEAALAEAGGGTPRLVVVAGEPGIGKSRLLDEFAVRASGRGAAVHWGRCREAGGAPPYWPWVQVLRTVVNHLDDGDLRSAAGDAAGEIAQLVTEVAQRLPGTPPSGPLDPDAARFRLFDAVATFLGRSSATRTHAVLLDDVHAADEPSLRLLEFLAAELRDCRVLLVVTSRTTEVVRSPHLSAALEALDRVPAVRRLRLAGLAVADVERYLAQVLGEDPTPRLVATVADQSDGNPLFVGEIVRLVQEEQRGDPAVGTRVLPSDVRDTILRRATHVSPGCNELLRVAAVIGRDVDVAVLRAVADRSEDEVADALDEAEGALLVSSGPDLPGRVRFTHALVRDALYGDVPARRRAMLHRDVGEQLESLHSGNLDAVLSELALHFFEAAPVGEARRAVDYARRAGEQAIRLLAYEEAVRLFELALVAVDLSRDHEPRERCELLLVLGDARTRAGDLLSAQEAFLRAAEIARAEGLAEHLARIALGYGGWYLWSCLRGDPYFVPLLRDALDALGPADHPLRVKLLARFGGGAMRDDPDRQARIELCEEAVAMARRIGDPETLAYAIDGHLGGLLWPENAAERLGLGAELVELGQSIGARDRVQAGHVYRCLAAIELADRRLAEYELDQLWRMAEELRSPVTQWSASVMASTLLLMDGRLAEAEELIEAAYAVSRAQAPDAPTHRVLQSFMLLKEQGRADEVLAELEANAARYPTRPLYRYSVAHLHAIAGREREATWALEALAVHDFEDLPRNDEWLYGMSLLAEVVEVAGDRERGHLLRELLLPHREQVAVAALVVGSGAVARPLGILASMLGRVDEADDHFATAVAVNQRLGAHLWVARTEYDWARSLQRADRPGDRDRAAGMLDRAAAVAAAVGSADLERRIAALRQGPTGAPPVPVRRLHRDGESWSVDFDGLSFRVQDTKGMQYLAQLVTRPHEPVHALELAGATAELHDGGAGAPVLDDRAKAGYQARLVQLDAEVDEAEAWGDLERAARARQEIQLLSEEVASALGHFGRDRRFASPSERARQSVTKAIRASIDRLGRQCPALGRHLAATVATGTFCTYNPDRDDPIWRA